MRHPWSFTSIYPAIVITLALLVVSHTTRAQTTDGNGEQNQAPRQSLTHELDLHGLRARQMEVRARHRAEMLALGRAAEELRTRAYDAALRSPSEASLTWPDNALGVIHINRPRQMTLLQLRGLAGLGTALLRLDDNCISIPLRFVAGDFGGDHITARRAPPIRIAIQSQEAIEMLLQGKDIISGMYVVSGLASDEEDGADSDLVLLNGLTVEHGFVINPGRSIIDDIFGVQGLYVPCEL
ncbi:MAG: hypothetical protein RIC24_00245 [Hyphomicrobiales bacterium]